MDESNQRFAVSVVGKDGQTKYDSRYVRLFAQFDIKNDDGSREFVDLPLHNCTEEDLAQFYDLDDEGKITMKTYETELGIELKDTLKCMS